MHGTDTLALEAGRVNLAVNPVNPDDDKIEERNSSRDDEEVTEISETAITTNIKSSQNLYKTL